MKTEFAATGEIFHTVKKLKANIEKIEIAVNVLFLDMMLTTYLVPTIATILAILFANIIKGFDKKKHKYEIKPAYQEKSILEVKLNCIISVKIVHIIHVINYFWKEKRRVKKNERTSHRSTYANGYG